MAVHPEDRDQDARRYQLLSAYLLLTGLMRRLCITVSPDVSDALRYRALKDHVVVAARNCPHPALISIKPLSRISGRTWTLSRWAD
ncbi:MAG: hypothetical protein ACJ746_02095 [Bryobacteraceae bacterium]